MMMKSVLLNARQPATAARVQSLGWPRPISPRRRISMKVAFLDPNVRLDYHVDTPLEEGLGGSQSALCYLAVEMALRGHQVSLINHISVPGEYRGVACVGWAEGATTRHFNQVDVLVVLNGAIGSALRAFGVRTPIVLWTQHAHDQPAMQELLRPIEREAWTGFAFVSAWQAKKFSQHFSIDGSHCRILNNCISPAFAAQPISEPWFIAGSAPVLAYTSTPFRGLDVLLRAFPLIRERLPTVRLRVYSSMAVYRVSLSNDEYRSFYAQAAGMEGVEYVGSVGQSLLAREIVETAALAYPNTFAETFCIAAAEALSTGAMLLTTRLGALPELYGGFARMTEPNSDRHGLAGDFAVMAASALTEVLRDPITASALRETQIRSCRARFSWPYRAREWESYLMDVINQHPLATVGSGSGRHEDRAASRR
jgi:glycosyltransferase involved in cell wall biosynthesis